MHIIHEKIWGPQVNMVSWDDNNAVFSISPLPAWYWMTLWNTLRRILLSTLPWTAVTWVKIVWVSHEYATLEWVKDSVLDIILNLKWICFKKHDKERTIVKIEKKWPWLVTAWDIQASSDLEVINPDHVITELSDKKSSISMEIIIEKWVWYLPSEWRLAEEDLAEFIFIDANFTPITKVKYNVTSARVWDMTNLDNLEITIETNWAIVSFDALKFAASIATSYFELFIKETDQIEPDFITDHSRCWMIEEEKEEKETYTPIEILNLSPRTLNALINADIWSIEQLSKCSQAKLWTLRGFWKKAMTEVLDALEKRDLKLLWD